MDREVDERCNVTLSRIMKVSFSTHPRVSMSWGLHKELVIAIERRVFGVVYVFVNMLFVWAQIGYKLYTMKCYVSKRIMAGGI